MVNGQEMQLTNEENMQSAAATVMRVSIAASESVKATES